MGVDSDVRAAGVGPSGNEVSHAGLFRSRDDGTQNEDSCAPLGARAIAVQGAKGETMEGMALLFDPTEFVSLKMKRFPLAFVVVEESRYFFG